MVGEKAVWGVLRIVRLSRFHHIHSSEKSGGFYGLGRACGDRREVV